MKPAYKLGRLHYSNFYIRRSFHFIETLKGENMISGLMEEIVKLYIIDMIKIYKEFKSLLTKEVSD